MVNNAKIEFVKYTKNIQVMSRKIMVILQYFTHRWAELMTGRLNY